MKTVLSKVALVVTLFLIAAVVVFTVSKMLRPASAPPVPEPHLPMIPSGSPELVTLLSKIDAIDGLRLMTANHTAENEAFRATGLAATREKISEYLGALERVGLRNYVLDVQDAPADSGPGLSFVITGKLTLK